MAQRKRNKKQKRNVLRVLKNIIKGTWMLTTTWWNERWDDSKNLLILFSILSGVVVGLFVTGIIFQWEDLIKALTLTVGWILILMYKITDKTVEIVKKHYSFKGALDELQSLVRPFRTIGLTCAWIGSVVALTGLDHFTGMKIWLVLTIGSFFIFFNFVIPFKNLLYEKILVWTLIVMGVMNYLAPVQLKAGWSWVDRATTWGAKQVNSSVTGGKSLYLPAKEVLFDEKGKSIKTLDWAVTARIIDTKTKNGDDMYVINIPDSSASGVFGWSTTEYFYPAIKEEFVDPVKEQKKRMALETAQYINTGNSNNTPSDYAYHQEQRNPSESAPDTLYFTDLKSVKSKLKFKAYDDLIVKSMVGVVSYGSMDLEVGKEYDMGNFNGEQPIELTSKDKGYIVIAKKI